MLVVTALQYQVCIAELLVCLQNVAVLSIVLQKCLWGLSIWLSLCLLVYEPIDCISCVANPTSYVLVRDAHSYEYCPSLSEHTLAVNVWAGRLVYEEVASPVGPLSSAG